MSHSHLKPNPFFPECKHVALVLTVAKVVTCHALASKVGTGCTGAQRKTQVLDCFMLAELLKSRVGGMSL